jgi:trimeric autotransporter adhesin
VFNRGTGLDIVSDFDSLAVGLDRILIGIGIAPEDVRVTRTDVHIVLQLQGTNDELRVLWYPEAAFRIEQVVFSNGTIWSADDLEAMALASIIQTGSDSSELLQGTSIDDVLQGNGGDDVLLGGAGDDRLEGGVGNDRLEAGLGENQLIGGDGNDVYVVVGSDDRIVEGLNGGIDRIEASLSYTLSDNVEDISLTGTASQAIGNELANRIVGNSSANTLIGGRGADTYYFAAGWGHDSIDDLGVEGLVDDGAVDTIQFGPGITLGDLQFRVPGPLLINRLGTGDSISVSSFLATPTGQVETIRFADGSTLHYDDIIQLASTERGTDGNDNMYAIFSGGTLYGGAGHDILNGAQSGDRLYGEDGDDWLRGWSGNDSMYGGSGRDELEGSDGDDFMDGGSDADRMEGGYGNDAYVVDSIDDVVVESNVEGVDRVTSSVTYTLSAYTEELHLTGTEAIDGHGNSSDNLIVGNAGRNLLTGGSGSDRLDGNAGTDTMVGGAGNDTFVVDNAGDVTSEAAGGGIDAVESSITWTLAADTERLVLTGSNAVDGTGNAAANTLTGNSAANRLNGGAGADAMTGGAGDDVYVVENASDTTIEAVDGGTDTVESSITWTLGSEVERLVLTGTGNLNGTGNASANTLTGNSGNNVLNGGAGNDTMAGGAGNDTYVVDAAGDVVTEATASGTDLVQSSVSYTLSTDVENLTLTGASAINGTGNALANNLTGNSADNVLDGGAGNDTLVGGAGNDTFVVDSTADVVTEAAAGGIDTVLSSVTLTLATEVENLTLTGATAINGTGNGLANTLRGNAANNTLNGGAGNDTMLGGAGDDTYVVDAAGDVVTENANEGADTVQAGLTYTLGANIENLTLTGTTAINGTGNALNNSMLGNSAANQLTGGAGDDVLNGAGGADTLVGGAGNDSYVVDNTADVVTEIAGEGADTIQSSVTYTLQANVENLVLTGTGNVNATGNADANTLTGNAGNNVLNGAAGADTMIGGAGNDSYTVDNVGDVVTELASAGTDTVNAGLTWTLAANVENLTLTGTNVINGTGNDLANTLTGNSANNLLTGGAGDDVINGGTGNDTMAGGVGNDSYTVNVATDVVTENAGEGTDTVNSSVTWALGNNLEHLVLTGTTALNGTGNTLDNTLTGNSGANVLQGLAGNDRYVGGAGNDTLTDNATTSNDVYVWGTGQGSDTLTDAGGSDRIEMLAGVTSSQVTLTRATNDLRIGITGSTDTLLIKNWYTGTANRIEQISFADGSTMALGTAAPASALASNTSLALKGLRESRSGVNGIKMVDGEPAQELLASQPLKSERLQRSGVNGIKLANAEPAQELGASQPFKSERLQRSGANGVKLAMGQAEAEVSSAQPPVAPLVEPLRLLDAWSLVNTQLPVMQGAMPMTVPQGAAAAMHQAQLLVQAMAGFDSPAGATDPWSQAGVRNPRAGMEVLLGVPMA